jgi:CBS domain-containing protein/predicted RNA-binding Zn-ribbon protein involved in translation (DUF1610 family)
MDSLDTPVEVSMSDPVETVDPDCTAREAAAILTATGIGSVVVVGPDRPPGVVTKTDLVAGLADGIDPDGASVASLATRPLVTVTPDATLRDAVDAMAREGVKRVLVVDDGTDDVRGVLSTTDLVATVADDAATDEAVADLFSQVRVRDAPDRYECVDCGRRLRGANGGGGDCPNCGGLLRNISVARE